ncbi:hypothetical protein E2C01_022239 [Portunus trituberculatus]|uniref:Uncharacterized protein n=1 Tax=Portunus trituberculatus TaxID=210409 RepID=A0A5B7E753_PORTR|nr:hypothetical protein [Portunus trituberculatus]
MLSAEHHLLQAAPQHVSRSERAKVTSLTKLINDAVAVHSVLQYSTAWYAVTLRHAAVWLMEERSRQVKERKRFCSA